MATTTHDIVGARLAEHDQRYTSGRRRLVEILDESSGPLTINQILEAAPSLPQSSAYRNLLVLEEAEAVVRVVTDDDHARFELAEELTGHHHHLVCTGCGDVADFSLPAEVEAELDRALRAAARKTGFAAAEHRLDLHGSCASCRPA